MEFISHIRMFLMLNKFHLIYRNIYCTHKQNAWIATRIWFALLLTICRRLTVGLALLICECEHAWFPMDETKKNEAKQTNACLCVAFRFTITSITIKKLVGGKHPSQAHCTAHKQKQIMYLWICVSYHNIIHNEIQFFILVFLRIRSAIRRNAYRHRKSIM